MGFWLAFSVPRRRSVPLAAGGMAAATLMACLALLSQSRGAALAMILSLAVVVAVVPGDRMRRILALVVAAAAVGTAAPRALDVYNAGVLGAVTPTVGHSAAVAMLLAGVGAGLVWAFMNLAYAR